MKRSYPFISCLLLQLLSIPVFSQLNLVSSNPAANSNHVAAGTNIVLTFNQAIDGGSLGTNTVIVRGNQTDRITGIFSGGGTSTITFNPNTNFKPGETISITITTALQSTTAESLPNGITLSFTTIAGASVVTPATFAHQHISFNPDIFPSEDVKVIDFEGDGDLDIIVGTEGSVGEATILWENDGNQKFCYRKIAEFRHVEVFDIDGDGDLDAFSPSPGFDSELRWYQNPGGSGAFIPQTITTADPYTLTAGDIDSDGDIDVLAPIISGSVTLFRNNGSGTFSASAISSTFTGGSDSYFSLADIDSDGSMDILAFYENADKMVWFRNNGTGTFTEILIANMTDPKRLTAIDLDDDGDIDILAASTASTTLLWLENDGNENFTQRSITSTIRPLNVKASDLDGDLDLDIIAGAHWFENDGNENFTERLISEGLRTGAMGYSTGTIAADLDLDGDLDLVTLGRYALSWQENNQFMSLVSTSPQNAALGIDPNATISIQFSEPISNASLSKNIIVFSQWRGKLNGNFSGGGSTVIVFDPAENFLPGEVIEVAVKRELESTTGHTLEKNYGFDFITKTGSASSPVFTNQLLFTHTATASGFDIADMDGDGDLDVISCSTTEIRYHQNDGLGNFTTSTIPTTVAPVRVSAADANLDGSMDIIVYHSTSTRLYLNDGNENFAEGPTQPNLNGITQQVTDINRDGDLDLLFTFVSPNPTNVRWGELNCNRYGDPGSSVPGNSGNQSARAIDLDQDGDIDLVGGGTLGVTAYINNGYLVYTTLAVSATSTRNLEFADLDQDGDPDIIVALNGTSISWYENRLNTGTQNFASAALIGNEVDPRSITATDIDGDGDIDIAAVSRSNDRVVWYENRLNEATNNFAAAQVLTTLADGPVLIQSGDLNGDGAMDLVILSDIDHEISWLASETTSCIAPTITAQPQNTTLCAGAELTLSVSASGDAPLTFQWQKDGDDINGATNATFTLSATTSTDAGSYQCVVSNTCGFITSNAAIVTINDQPSPPVVSDQLRCGEGLLVLSATGGTNGNYRWYTTATEETPIAGEFNSTYTTPELSISTTYYVSITDGTCESDRSAVTAILSIVDTPSISITGNTTFCQGENVTLHAPEGFTQYLWSTGETTQSIIISTTGNYTVVVTNDDNCNSLPSAAMAITVNECTGSAPIITTETFLTALGSTLAINALDLISDPDNDLDLTTLRVLNNATMQGAQATIDANFIITLNYTNLNFSGTDYFILEVCDLEGACVQQQIAIEIASEIIVYNALSPNNDGLNDIFLIQYIDAIEQTKENRVTIFNRWGDVVFEISNYNNTTRVFTGQNKNGQNLPSGTYFYKIEFKQGLSSLTGFISLKR